MAGNLTTPGSNLPSHWGPYEHSLFQVFLAGWHTGIDEKTWLAFQVIHTILTVVALLTNCLSLCVIYGVMPRLTAELQTYTSLAFANMLCPWAVVTVYFPLSPCQDEIHTALLLTSHNACALTVMILAMCHQVSTFKPLQYDKTVTTRRLWVTVNLIWVLSILAAHVHFLAVVVHHNPKQSFCLQVQQNSELALTMASAIAGAAFLLSSTVYVRIFLHLRPLGSLPATESRKSTRSVVTGMILAGSFFCCWVPFIVVKFEHVESIDNATVRVGLFVTQTLVLLNAVTNPLVYALRMCSVQNGYLSLYHRARGWLSHSYRRVFRAEDTESAVPSTPLNPIESIC